MLVINIGVIGTGNIGGIFVRQFSEYLKENENSKVYFFDKNEKRAMDFSDIKNADYCDDLKRLCSNSDLIFIAVKPQDSGRLFDEIKEFDFSNKVIISTMAGITRQTMEKGLLTRNIVRIMPNVPISIGKGVIGVDFSDHISQEKVDEICSLLEVLGIVVKIEGKNFPALTALSGSSPAFIFVMIETLIDAGLMMGLSYDVSKKLVLGTLAGTTSLLMENDKLHPAVMRNKVTSPGGTTIDGIYRLEREGLRGILLKTMLETHNKARELSKEE